MAAARRASEGVATVVAAAAVILVMSLLFSADPAEACGRRCPGATTKTKPPSPSSPAPSGVGGKCSLDALELGVCADVLGGGLTNLLGRSSRSATSTRKPCCELVSELADLDAAVCLCTAVQVNVLGIVDLDLPVQLSLLVNHCGKKLPAGFQCPN